MPKQSSLPKAELPSSELWLIRAGLVLALAIAVFLAWNSLQGGGIPGCGPESGCDKVLTSRWAYLFGLPVSLFAIPAYVALLSLAKRTRVRWNLVVPLAFLVLFAGLWFIGVQAFALRAFCKFCMTAHAGGVLASLLLLKNADFSVAKPAIALVGAASLVGIVAAVQATAPERGPKQIAGRAKPAPVPITPITNLVAATVTNASAAIPVSGTNAVNPPTAATTQVATASVTTNKPAWSPKFPILEGRFTLDLTQLPISGPVNAPKRMAKLFDYTCKHCRDLQHLLTDFRRKYPDQLVVVSLPLPLDAGCNPVVKKTPAAHEGACAYARLGLAVYHANPAKFEEFSDWIFAPEHPPEITVAQQHAEELVGSANLQKALRHPAIDDQIRADVNIYTTVYRIVHAGNLPQLYFEEGSSIGAINSSDQLAKIMADNLGFPLPGK